ncbi:MAG: hypothetical protein H0T79_23375 [Deltaproteobacteria bacterium]|nr:hypothetical protein [Deltaproteobacteria bacterium]
MIWQLVARDSSPPMAVQPPRVVAAPPTDAALAVPFPLDAAVPSRAITSAAPAVVASRPDAGRVTPVVPRRVRLVAPVASPTEPARITARRRVTINARPWANFTIDGDPTPHQTIETVELVPGAHTIHFSNARLDVERDVVIEVPADRDMTHITHLE